MSFLTFLDVPTREMLADGLLDSSDQDLLRHAALHRSDMDLDVLHLQNHLELLYGTELTALSTSSRSAVGRKNIGIYILRTTSDVHPAIAVSVAVAIAHELLAVLCSFPLDADLSGSCCDIDLRGSCCDIAGGSAMCYAPHAI